MAPHPSGHIWIAHYVYCTALILIMGGELPLSPDHRHNQIPPGINVSTITKAGVALWEQEMSQSALVAIICKSGGATSAGSAMYILHRAQVQGSRQIHGQLLW